MSSRPRRSTQLSDSQSEAALAEARSSLAAFLVKIAGVDRPLVFHDVDADGIAAGVLLVIVLEHEGYSDVRLLAPGRARNAWTEDSRMRIEGVGPQALFVLDLGSRSEPVVPRVPTCFIDHHRPGGCPPGHVLISGYEWRPTPCTSLIVHLLGQNYMNLDPFDWVTALGIISDLGEKAPYELLERAKKKFSAKWLKEATVLVNASRRGSNFAPEAAVRAIRNHATPRELVLDERDEDVRFLRAARAEVQAALVQAKKEAPVFAGRIALLRVRSPCQIHPLIAQIWRNRLPGYLVLAANEGYLPGRVNFSARSNGERAALDWLRSYEVNPGEGVYGHGHDQASGGSLPYKAWNDLLIRMGFGPEVLAVEQ